MDDSKTKNSTNDWSLLIHGHTMESVGFLMITVIMKISKLIR